MAELSSDKFYLYRICIESINNDDETVAWPLSDV